MGTCPLLSRPPHALLQTLPSRLSCAPSSNMSGPPWAASLWENAMLAYIPSRLAIAAITCAMAVPAFARSEEHTSELQSQSNLVCRLLLEKKKSSLALLDLAPPCI